MGGFFSPSPQTGSTSGTSTTTYTPSPNVVNEWNQILGTAGGLASNAVNNYQYPGQMVAGPSGLTNQYWTQAAGTQAPDLMGLATVYGNLVGTVGQMGVNPQNIQISPGALNLPTFGATPNVSAPGGVSGLASNYLVNPLQVNAPQAYMPQNVQAPGAINPITGVPNVAAPSLQQYAMGPAQQVNAPNLSQFQMQAAGNVGPTGSWTAPGVSSQYMSPYVQDVVNAQLAQAQTQEQQQLAMQGGQAAQAGAFGGSRQAVEAANTSIGYQQLASQLQAQGLQNAYQAGMGQFNTEQQLGLQAQLANQQAQQQANVQNLSALLQTQGLQAQTGLQSQLANQQAGLTVGQQNLGAQLSTQALGAQTGLQAALANQQMSYQSQLANQQAQEFGYGQNLQAQLANQQAGLQAGLANQGYQMQAQQLNQQAGLQAGLAAQQMGLTGAQFNASNAMQAQMANQAAQMQALGMQYQGGLQGALQNQQLGLQAQVQQNQLQQAQQQNNLAMTNQMGQLAGGMANTELNQFQAGLQGLGAVAGAAQSQQGYQQQLADAAYQQWMNQFTLPMQATGWQAGLTAMQPLPYTMNNVYSGTSTMMPSQPSGLTQALNAALGGLGAIGGIFGFSDVRLKEDIRPVGGIAGIPLYSYRFKGLPGRQVGPMAQEVYQKWPETVVPGDDSRPWMIDVTKFLDRLHAEAGGGLGQLAA